MLDLGTPHPTVITTCEEFPPPNTLLLRYSIISIIHIYHCILAGSVLCQNSPCENGGTCYYIGGESQIECVCPENYLGEFCQYEGKYHKEYLANQCIV